MEEKCVYCGGDLPEKPTKVKVRTRSFEVCCADCAEKTEQYIKLDKRFKTALYLLVFLGGIGFVMPFEDCALYMNIPNAVVIDSCDFAQTKALTRKLAACGSPSYMHLIRKGFTTVYADGSDFEIGKGVTLRDGKDVTIIASGILVDEALKAEEMLAAKGISARVIDMHTWKPLDEELVLRAAAETGCIVTAENHQVGTGLGSAITNLTSAKNPVPVERIGIQNRFGQVGPQDFLMQQYNLTAEDITAAALRTIVRRQG